MTLPIQLLLGHQGITLGTQSDGAYGQNDLVGLFGSADVLTAGDENVLAGGFASDSVVTLGNGADAVGLIGDHDIVTLGAIQTDAVTGPGGAGLIAGLLGAIGLTAPVGPADLVALVGTGNSLSVAGAVDALLIGTDNAMRFGDPSLASTTSTHPASGSVRVDIVGSGDHIVEAASGVSGTDSPLATITGGSGANYADVISNARISLGGQQNTILVGGGSIGGSHFDIMAGSGDDSVILRNGFDASGNLVASSDVVRLSGLGNQVSGGSDATILGGSGDATLNLGTPANTAPGLFTVSLDGAGNSITLQHAVAVGLNAGSGDDTVHLLDAAGSLTFHGTGDMLFIGGLGGSGGASGAGPAPILVNDQSRGLAITIASALSSAAPLTVIGADRSLLIDLAPGIGNLGTAAQITARLHSDGAGGTVLSAGVGAGSPALIHFVGDAHISAANFGFG